MTRLSTSPGKARPIVSFSARKTRETGSVYRKNSSTITVRPEYPPTVRKGSNIRKQIREGAYMAGQEILLPGRRNETEFDGLAGFHVFHSYPGRDMPYIFGLKDRVFRRFSRNLPEKSIVSPGPISFSRRIAGNFSRRETGGHSFFDSRLFPMTRSHTKPDCP